MIFLMNWLRESLWFCHAFGLFECGKVNRFYWITTNVVILFCLLASRQSKVDSLQSTFDSGEGLEWPPPRGHFPIVGDKLKTTLSHRITTSIVLSLFIDINIHTNYSCSIKFECSLFIFFTENRPKCVNLLHLYLWISWPRSQVVFQINFNTFLFKESNHIDFSETSNINKK